MVIIKTITSHDVRFPTSLDKAGSDGMNLSPDYSAAFCIITTDDPNFTGHGMTFTIGRGNELVCGAIDLLAPLIQGKDLSDLTKNWGKTWRYLTSDSQLRWVGPEKGVIHLALGALVNAIWDLWAKTLGKPVWRVVADMTPEEVIRCIDFRYISDVLSPNDALEILRAAQKGKAERIQEALNNRAVPAYTTSAGWLGYGEDKMKKLLEESVKEGFNYFKLKVGTDLEEDRQRLRIARDVLGYDKGNVLMVDANQVWSVTEAITHMNALAEFKPWFIEEPTSPDDILGHAAIRQGLSNTTHGAIAVATGEMCQNRVMFKQLLQAGAVDIIQPDACRVGGVNEVLAILLLAAKFKVPIVPHSGGVGLPEYTQHLSTIDYVVISGRKSVLEYVDHLHEHFHHPSKVVDGHYVTPLTPGYSVEMKPESLVSCATGRHYHDNKFKFIIYRIANNELVVENTSDGGVWDDLKERLLSSPKNPAFAVYDFGDSYDHKLAFVSWCPDTAPPRPKMIYGNSRDAVKQSFDGISLDISASDIGDLDESEILERLDKV
ncbi:mandelate racemase [Fusarium napiforme]|uniref:Cofilin n=1 Tax=Fusarium napiforme TaxID=42672 RepID=A0A8H5INB2_9HYPO|nr:mandelate racemase [Fusarium napiforme]